MNLVMSSPQQVSVQGRVAEVEDVLVGVVYVKFSLFPRCTESVRDAIYGKVDLVVPGLRWGLREKFLHLEVNMGEFRGENAYLHKNSDTF